jgi:hypothetical protein|tara:strand:- start:875 stop:1186 length:312 start_codon:yes stop_codon:yes gene_type:complete
LAKKIWTIWKYALGSFSDDKTKSYDNVIAITRTFIFISYLITNCFIISGVIRHWNNMPHQTNKAKAQVTWFTPEPETKEEEYESLEEALTGEKLKEPEGDPSY